MSNSTNQAEFMIGQVLDRALRTTPDQLAVVCDEDTLTYRQLDDAVQRFARALTGWGVGKGDRVILFMRNRTEFVPLYIALFRLGAVAVPLACFYQTAAVSHAACDSQSRFMIVSGEVHSRVENVRTQAPSLEAVAMLDDCEVDWAVAWKDLTENAPPSVSPPDIVGEDTAMILYTSGSTALPKGVVHTHATLFHQIVNKIETMQYDENTVNLTASQLPHVSGVFAAALPTLYRGGTVVLMESFAPDAYLDLLNRHGATDASVPPLDLFQIIARPLCERTDFSTIRYFTTGGDNVPGRLHDLLLQHTGVELRESYGMTECEGFLTNPPFGKNKPGSIGLPIYGTEVRIVDRDGKDVAQGETGEITLRSKAMMKEYWNNPEATKSVLIEGWLRTGDLGYQDEEGYYYFGGRCRNVILRDGQDIIPEEVESVLNEHPGVHNSGILGLPDDRHDNVICAFIVRDPDGSPQPTAGTLTAFARERLPSIEVPERWAFVDEIPLTDAGKISRKRLNQMAKAALTD